MWIVMTAAAQMPASCRGSYRRVALVRLNQEYTAKDWQPKMISERARGILEIARVWDRLNVGVTHLSAYYRALAEAQRQARELNNAQPAAAADLLTSWGGSA